MPRILIVAGEASGDLHGANLGKALRALRPDAQILGMGGEKMKSAGINVMFGIEGQDVIGLVRPSQVAMVVRRHLALASFIRRTHLDAVVFIDCPGFNLRMARIAARAGCRVVYYIAPQVWAWHPTRMRVIKQVVHRMIVILPFEEALFRDAGVQSHYVGHPILDSMGESYNQSELRQRFGVARSSPVLGLLPGSREREVQLILPLMLEAAAILRHKHAGLGILLAQAPSLRDDLIESTAKGAGLDIRIAKDQPNEVIAASDVLLVTSGTATLQAAVIGTPMVMTYRLPWLSYWLALRMLRISSVGLVNILAGRRVVPELIQSDATPERLAQEADRLITDRDAYEQMRTNFKAVRVAAGTPGASQRAAALILEECRG